MNEDRRKLRKLVDMGEGDATTDVLGFDRRGWSYAIITQIDTEKERRRIVRYHIQLHCLNGFWFDFNHDNLPPWDQIAHAAAMFHTELIISPEELELINAGLGDPEEADDSVPLRSNLRPAHIHEGNWIRIFLDPDKGWPVTVFTPLPSSGDPAGIGMSGDGNPSCIWTLARITDRAVRARLNALLED